MIVPADQLSQEALRGVIEEWLTRQAQEALVDHSEWPTQVENVKQQLLSGRLLLTWDDEQQSLNIQRAEDLS
ncbi:YheU family protein [Reinekea blandensis]|uniref:YheU family protein n=1 Tax=Reinekea blandensis MED297 TaxID=314283 RepID=A4BHE1_9GAMM|nr:YheU family protein [Reinekea blandensis]EAR08489.1 hypothetical protein MED297_17892 [Reinekea sp. MED297] [Reinekea blandensis MED297]